ncbi:MAG: TIGR00730 family Rossman fold protein [Ilumatobacteraceae bacterium]
MRTRARALLQEMGIAADARLAEDFLAETLGLILDRPDHLDLKIAAAAVTEMRDAFSMFAPYRAAPKVTIFGSARVKSHDPLYEQTREVAARLAARGWMVITGAGPGIMQAGMEGAGRENSIGVSIRLPFEQGANPVIAGDEKYVSMKYFFTRKLMLVKESRAFVCLPGGFGTLDETFELLTLTQTGKGLPVPIVFLDTPGDEYWEHVHEFVEEQLVSRGLVAAGDTGLYRITDSTDVAVEEIERFYSNFDSIRYVGDDLVIRLQRAPTDAQLAELNQRFGHLVSIGEIRCVEPSSIERRQDDRLEFDRIAFAFAKHGYGDLRAMIDVLNGYAVTPA